MAYNPRELSAADLTPQNIKKFLMGVVRLDNFSARGVAAEQGMNWENAELLAKELERRGYLKTWPYGDQLKASITQKGQLFINTTF